MSSHFRRLVDVIIVPFSTTAMNGNQRKNLLETFRKEINLCHWKLLKIFIFTYGQILLFISPHVVYFFYHIDKVHGCRNNIISKATHDFLINVNRNCKIEVFLHFIDWWVWLFFDCIYHQHCFCMTSLFYWKIDGTQNTSNTLQLLQCLSKFPCFAAYFHILG